MKRYVLILLIVIAGLSSAQDKSRGVSAPGSIGKAAEASGHPIQASDISCVLSFEEPSGDHALSEGESGRLVVKIRNLNQETVLSPKLEISIQSSWSPMPRTSQKTMDRIGPGEEGEYASSINWDEKLPSGTITYKVQAADAVSDSRSTPVQISFSVIGKGRQETEPVFVDVDGAVPRTGSRNPDAVAVVIGNQTYGKDTPEVEFAGNDASVMKKYLLNMLGYREGNVLLLQNAQKADFERIFGTHDVHQGKLYNLVRPGRSDVFIYYSGHGAPDLKTKKAFFVPVNADPNYLQIDGYSLDVFYANLEKIPARSMTVVLDACFSGGSQKGALIKNASPMHIDIENPILAKRFNLFTSSSGDQISSWYPEGKHSLFTYYFLRAIRGEADGNKDRQVTVREVQEYISENVPYTARRIYGREQTPMIKGNSQTIICTY